MPAKKHMTKVQRLALIASLTIGLLSLVFYTAYRLEATENKNKNALATCHVEHKTLPIKGGQFTIGSNTTYREEALASPRQVNDFWIDNTEVTVERFKQFVEATGYITEAEQTRDIPATDNLDDVQKQQLEALRQPGGAVFFSNLGELATHLSWWQWTPGANWQQPEGPSKNQPLPQHPATQISYYDASQYAQWAGGRLPTEAEWEYAALAGKKNIDFDADTPEQANTWQGSFPVYNTGDDGHAGVAPVGCYAANEFGLHDMIGNVWEWTADPYHPYHVSNPLDSQHETRSDQYTPPIATSPLMTIKGGSYLCAENYCRRYRPAARHGQEADLSTNHIGFRVVYDSEPKSDLN
jgi:formylglycine-generating enzyme required for sulfatase activity